MFDCVRFALADNSSRKRVVQTVEVPRAVGE